MSDIQLFHSVPAKGPSIGMADAFAPLPLASMSGSSNTQNMYLEFLNG
jgi:hypothetical protein